MMKCMEGNTDLFSPGTEKWTENVLRKNLLENFFKIL